MATELEQQQIIARFEDLRHSLSSVLDKVSDVESQIAEHQLVIKTLEEMDSSRKCFRLIGDVLVERNVGETLPAVKKHKDALVEVLKSLSNDLVARQKELSEFQMKYKIRVKGEPDDKAEESSQGGSSSSANQGVLVS